MDEIKQIIGLNENRLKHCRAVAEKAYKLASELTDWDEEKCSEMYVLGFLHDVGYAFAVNQEDHERIGGEILGISGYKYWKEVYWHGRVTDQHSSRELDILNLADLLTNFDGEPVSISERLKSIGERYGFASTQSSNAKRLADSLATYGRQEA